MRLRYLVGFILVIVLVIFLFTFVFHSSSPSKKVSAPPSLSTLANTDDVVQYTQDGVINADQDHRAIRITIGQAVSDVSIIQGYQGNVINSDQYPNNQAAYSAFLNALVLEDYTTKLKTSYVYNNAVCPLGQRFTFEIIDGSGNVLQNLWSTSCGAGNFGGDLGNTQTLFTDQIPDYSVVTQNVSLQQ